MSTKSARNVTKKTLAHSQTVLSVLSITIMLLWRQSTGLIVVLALCATSAIVTGDNKQNVQSSPSNSATTLSPRKMDVDRQAGGLAGPMFLGLASMLFPVLPVLLLAPLAMGGLGPVMNFLGGSSSNEQSASPIGDFINTIGGGGGSGSLGGGLGGAGSSGLGSLGGGNSDQSSAASTLSGIAQLMGLGGNSAAESSSSAGGFLSSLLGGGGSSGSSGPSASSLLNTLFESSSSGSSPSLFGSSSGSSAFGNTAAGSRPVPSIALPPNKISQGGGGVGSMSAADLLGAAAAALDNAGVLGSLGGLSGSSGASALAQLLSSVGGLSGGGNGGGNSLFGGNQKQPMTASSNALSEILSGISSNIVGQPAQSASPSFGTQKLPPLGSSLSSNIIQGLPMNSPLMQQNMNAGMVTGNFNPSSASSASGALSSLLGLGNSGAQSG